jgi:hypothetical protein
MGAPRSVDRLKSLQSERGGCNGLQDKTDTAADLVVLSLHLRTRGIVQGGLAMCGHAGCSPLGQVRPFYDVVGRNSILLNLKTFRSCAALK